MVPAADQLHPALSGAAHRTRPFGWVLLNASARSIGHRSTLEAFHKRRLAMVRDGDRFKLREEAGTP